MEWAKARRGVAAFVRFCYSSPVIPFGNRPQQITLNAGRSVEQKRALYARIVALLAENPGIRPQDVLINLVEVPRENWSFGSGEAQYAA